MKTSLVSREVVADSIELVGRGHLFDAVVALAACDKTIPGAVMGLARLDVPSVLLYGGSIAPGRFKGHDVTIQDVFEAVGAHAAGKMTDEELTALEDVASPGAGACGGAVHRQHDGDGLRAARHLADGHRDGPRREPAARPTSPTRSGELVMDVLARGQRPSRHHHPRGDRERDRRRRHERRLDQRACCTCSRSRARSGVPLCDRRLRPHHVERRRCCATSSPAGATWRSTSSTRGRRSRSWQRRCRRSAGCTRTRQTVTGKTVGEHARQAEETPGRRSSSRSSEALKATGGIAILRGNLAPDGCVVKLAGHDRVEHDRAGARLRVRGGRDGGGDRRAGSRTATSWSSATRARPAARGCARCSRSPPRSSARGSATPSR